MFLFVEMHRYHNNLHAAGTCNQPKAYSICVNKYQYFDFTSVALFDICVYAVCWMNACVLT